MISDSCDETNAQYNCKISAPYGLPDLPDVRLRLTSLFAFVTVVVTIRHRRCQITQTKKNTVTS